MGRWNDVGAHKQGVTQCKFLIGNAPSGRLRRMSVWKGVSSGAGDGKINGTMRRMMRATAVSRFQDE